MGKTKKIDPDKKLTDYKKLQLKYENRKLQIIRLKSIIRSLEKKLEKYEAGIVGTSDKGRPIKEVKPIKKEQLIDTKRDILDKFKQLYSKKEVDENTES